MFHQIVNALNSLAQMTPWAAIAASSVISPFLVGVKKWLSIQSERVMVLLVIGLSMAAAGLNYLLHVPTHDPSIIALQGAVVAFMTQPMYFFIVKPAIAFFKQEVEKAAQLNLDVKSAVVPPTGVVAAPTVEAAPATTPTPINVTEFTN
jgi:hypothetical protein